MNEPWVVEYWMKWLFGGITTVVSGIFWVIIKKQREQSLRQLAIEEGLKGVLHDHIYQLYMQCLEKGYISIAELDNLEYLFIPYKALKGNNTGEHMYDAMKKMPNIPPAEQIKKLEGVM